MIIPNRLRRISFSVSVCVLTAAFASMFGCKQSTSPSSNDSTKTGVAHVPGEFGWTANSTTTDRKDFPGVQSYGSVSRGDFGPGRSYQLDITISVYVGPKSVENQVELVLPMPTAKTGTFNIANTADLTNATATLKLDTARYYGIPGGTITITKIDTVNNTVSGTFSFDGNHGADKEHVTSGFFTDIPIYYNPYDQPEITATINGAPFTSKYAKISPSFWTVDSAYGMVMTIDGDNNGDGINEISFAITAPLAGYFYDLNGDNRWYGAYAKSGTPVISLTTGGNTVGRMTISKFDWATKRISATFWITGYDDNGDYIDIENGVIDNVQWFEL